MMYKKEISSLLIHCLMSQTRILDTGLRLRLI